MIKNKYSLIILATLIVGVLLIGNLSYPNNQQLSGSEILDKANQREEDIMGGSLITYIQFDTENPDGTTTHFSFRSLGKSEQGKPDKTLMYFYEPEDARGSLFLVITPEEGDPRLWLYLPALEQTKELVSEQEREGSFAGSALSYEDVGRQGEITEDYNAEVVGEKAVTVEDSEFDCYLLEITAKEGADVDHPTGKMWVSKGQYLILKSEFYNRSNNLEMERNTLKLGEFDGKVVANKFVINNPIEEKTTTITFSKRERPEEEIPESVFDPEGLAQFDPAKWGFTS